MILKLSILTFAAALGFLAVRLLCKDPALQPLCWLIYFIPFCSGGFYAGACSVVSAGALFWLIWHCWNQEKFNLHLSDPLLAVIAVSIGSVLAIFWAADHGTAPWGIVHTLPLLLFSLILLQLEKSQMTELYCLVPLSGAVMTTASFVLFLFPAVKDQVSVAGRLSGFFEYPNVFAAFLLAGLIISATNLNRSKWSFVIELVLIFGIFQSGSRTVFVMLVVMMLILCIYKRERRIWFGLWGAFAVCIAWSLIVPMVGGNDATDRYLLTSLNSSTLMGRLLYYTDALKLIAKHPLGLGYSGYHAVQGTYQTGYYDVAYVHNGILQIFLDVGWLPALMMCWAILRSFFSKKTTLTQRLLLLVIVGHSMLDLDLEYLSMWLLLLPALQFHQPKPIKLRRGANPAVVVGTVLLSICLWLSVSDGLYRSGRIGLCLKMTPFHSQAQIHDLTAITEAEQLEEAADWLLKLNPYCSVAYSAKANAASAMGDASAMVEAKKKAISCARYHLNEYLDYFDKLQEVMRYYQSVGDTASAATCAQLLQEIPTMLKEVRDTTSPLAGKLGDQPELVLPEAYQKILADLAS